MDAMTSLHANEIARFFHRNCGDYEREFDSCRLFDPATIENLDAAGVIIENRYNQIVTLATIAYPVKSPEWGLVGIALPPIDREGKLVFVHAVACVPWLRPISGITGLFNIVFSSAIPAWPCGIAVDAGFAGVGGGTNGATAGGGACLWNASPGSANSTSQIQVFTMQGQYGAGSDANYVSVVVYTT
jgi:hypothetical protein